MQRAKRAAALALGVLATLGGGTAVAAPAKGPTVPAPAKGPTVSAALQSLERAGAISPTVYGQDYAIYVSAKNSLAKLTGTRHEELGAVLANVQAMAAAGYFIPSRLPVIFLTLERNRQWWTTELLISGEARETFPPSKIVWEHYPGQGLEIQWLATFGVANGYYLSGHENNNLRELLNEVIPLATDRAGGIAWEYMFQFDGGKPPWTSGLSQGTAIQALSRGWQRLKEQEFLTAAQQALGIFQQPPPQGVRVNTPVGAMYAEYTYAPSDKILNGFIQSLVGLYEYTLITKDPLGEQLFEAGDAEARAIVPYYNTGAWSMYDQYGESDLNYHELLTEFLQHLCEKTRKGPPIAQTNTPIAGDALYCTTAAAFTADLHTPPVIALLSTTLPANARAGVQLSLSKVATVAMTVREGSKVAWKNTALVERGKPKLLWVTPTKSGTFSVSLTATDLAGNVASTSGTIVVRKP